MDDFYLNEMQEQFIFYSIIIIILLIISVVQYVVGKFKILISISSIFSRMVRGVILVFWIAILVWVSFGSLTGYIADRLFSAGNRNLPYSISLDKDHCKGSTILSSYLDEFGDDPPPVREVLDSVMVTWDGAVNAITQNGQPEKCDLTAYRALFKKVSDKLYSIAQSDNVDLKTITLDVTVLTVDFLKLVPSDNKIRSVDAGVQNWVTRERERNKNKALERSLFSTFLLLSTLGAFGSLIFLIRDYITIDEEHMLSDYLFRPVLGIFLAVAVFVVDVLAHSIISSASVLQVRPEPLYTLALGAGLLSETAYDWVRRNIDANFARREEQSKSVGQSTDPPQIPDLRNAKGP